MVDVYKISIITCYLEHLSSVPFYSTVLDTGVRNDIDIDSIFSKKNTNNNNDEKEKNESPRKALKRALKEDEDGFFDSRGLKTKMSTLFHYNNNNNRAIMIIIIVQTSDQDILLKRNGLSCVDLLL